MQCVIRLKNWLTKSNSTERLSYLFRASFYLVLLLKNQELSIYKTLKIARFENPFERILNYFLTFIIKTLFN